MAFKFRPVDGTFFDELATLAKHLEQGADLLAQVLDDDADRSDVANRLAKAESEADQISSSIIRKVNQTFVTPIDREDIYDLATRPGCGDEPDGRGRGPDHAL